MLISESQTSPSTPKGKAFRTEQRKIDISLKIARFNVTQPLNQDLHFKIKWIMGKQQIDTQNCKLPKQTKVAVIKEKFSINPTLEFNIDTKKPVGNKLVTNCFQSHKTIG
jgi:hypothetical protein